MGLVLRLLQTLPSALSVHGRHSSARRLLLPGGHHRPWQWQKETWIDQLSPIGCSVMG